MEKVLKSKYYSLIVALIMFIFWFVSFLQYSKEGHIPSNYLVTIESVELTIIGAICAFLLIRYFDMFYVVPWLTYTPFVFSRPFDTTTIPYALFIAVGLFAVGFIIHLIRWGIYFRIGTFFAGLALLAIAIILGGINTHAEYLKDQIIFAIPASMGLLIIYTLFASGVEVNFRTLAHLINGLGILLCLEVMASINHSAEPLSFIVQKNIDVGWGISNNIAIMLLFTIPCSVYLAIRSKGAKITLYVFSGFAQGCIVVATYARGAIVALAVGLVILVIISIVCFTKENKKGLIIYLSSLIVFTGIAAGVLMLFLNTKNETWLPYAEGFKENISHLNLENFNGRTPIYEHYIEEFKANPIFGKGLYSPFFDNEFTGEYQWGHSTFIHTMYTMGLVGLIALGFHMIQKYLNLLIKPNLEKVLMACSFFISGLYGLVDVSYYFINYMIVLLMSLVCLERTVRLSFDVV